MFISRHVYDDQRVERLKATAEADALRSTNIQLNAHIEWMRIRLTQVETERALLIKRYMGVDIPVPTFESTEVPTDLNQTLDFQDMGDLAAEKMGLGWNDDGTLRVTKS